MSFDTCIFKKLSGKLSRLAGNGLGLKSIFQLNNGNFLMAMFVYWSVLTMDGIPFPKPSLPTDTCRKRYRSPSKKTLKMSWVSSKVRPLVVTPPEN